MVSVTTPSAWYGTCNMATGASYSCLRISNHFMNVKHPVYESRSRSGSGRGSPVGPTFPAFFIPRSHFTYVQTSSECPAFSAAAI